MFSHSAGMRSVVEQNSRMMLGFLEGKVGRKMTFLDRRALDNACLNERECSFSN